MTTVIAHHEVKDNRHWLASTNREAALGPLGASNIRTFVNPQDPSQVAVMRDGADLDAMLAVVQNPPAELGEAMERDGVLPETMSILVAS